MRIYLPPPGWLIQDWRLSRQNMNFADVKRWLPPTFGMRFAGTFNPPLPLVRFRTPCWPAGFVPRPGFCARGRRVFRRLYARLVTGCGLNFWASLREASQQPVIRTCGRVSRGLQVRRLKLTIGVILGLHRAFNSCRQMPDSWRQYRRCRNLNAALAADLRLALVRRQGMPKISRLPRGCPGSR